MPFSKMLLSLFLFIVAIVTYAQADDTACKALVEHSVSSTAASCVSKDGNTVCSAQSSVTSGGITTSLNQPSSVSSINSIQSNALNILNDSWGIAIMNITAQPDNQTVWMLLLGDSSIEKQGDNFQNMRLKTGFGSDDCANIPNLVAIYAIGDSPVDLIINDTRLSLQGVATFQFQNLNSFVVTLLSGSMEISEANPIQAGESLVAVTDNEGSVLFWSAARPMTELEQEQSGIVVDTLSRLTGETVSLKASCEPTIYTTASGDNLYRIALRFGTTVEDIAKLNNIADVRHIQAGQQIKIPCTADKSQAVASGCGPNTIHIVSRGETLFGIAQQYGTTVNAIARANQLVHPDTIHAGNILQIPCDDGSAASPNPAPNPTSDASNGPGENDAGSLQQLCAGLAATINQTDASPQLKAFYQQTCGG